MDCIVSQSVQSLLYDFRVCEFRRHSGGLGWLARVSGRQFPDFRPKNGAFVVPISTNDFPISVSACRRPVRYGTETGSQGRTLGVERTLQLAPDVRSDLGPAIECAE
jgi:hypothetical protein